MKALLTLADPPCGTERCRYAPRPARAPASAGPTDEVTAVAIAADKVPVS